MNTAEAIADARRTNQLVEVGNLTPALAKCSQIVRGDIRENFNRRGAPDGGAWPPRKPWPGDDGHPLLEDTGYLRAAAQGTGPGGFGELAPREVTIGIDMTVDMGGIAAAAAHNFGNPDTNLPQREFFAATEEGLDRCADEIGDATMDMLE